MQNIRKIYDDLIYIGCSDRKITKFEGVYPISSGMAYNSYLLVDEDKTILFDTIDKACAKQFFENLKAGLNNRDLDYMIIQHMEPDHCAMIEEVVSKYPKVKIITNNKTVGMIKQFFDFDIESRVQIVKEGDIFETKNHSFTFVLAPMVHWPEVMVTYDIKTKTLFSADAFGSFGANNGNIFDDEIDFNSYIDEARRYYTNIVGKYGAQVQALLKKASALEIKMICPLHGVILKENIAKFIEKYNLWSLYAPETKSVLIAYGSIYGGTQNISEIIANKLAQKGIKNIKMYDVSTTHYSYILSDAFKYSNIILSSITYNMGIFEAMDTLLNVIVNHNLQNRKISIIQNGSWAPSCENIVKNKLEKLKNIDFIGDVLTIKSTPKENQEDKIDELVDKIIKSLN